jgi:hypothetical protein
MRADPRLREEADRCRSRQQNHSFKPVTVVPTELLARPHAFIALLISSVDKVAFA